MSSDGASYEFQYRSIVERMYPALAADAFYRTMEDAQPPSTPWVFT